VPKLRSKFIDKDLAASTWADVTTEFSLPDFVMELQFRNTDAAMEIRNSTEAAKVEEYPVNVSYALKGVPRYKHDVRNLQVKGTAGNTVLGEFVT